jgi:DNA-binding NarL/FixJ family response regulator
LKITKYLQDVPHPDEITTTAWRLIFLDCHGLSDTDIVMLLQAEASHLLGHDVVALFNLARDNTHHLALLKIGVRGFFYEDDQGEILLKGICALNSGEIWVSRETMMEYITKQTQLLPLQDHDVSRLTRREREILVLISCGSTNESISSKLYISMHTVKTHIYNIFKKIGVPNRLQAALWAAKHLQ